MIFEDFGFWGKMKKFWDKNSQVSWRSDGFGVCFCGRRGGVWRGLFSCFLRLHIAEFEIPDINTKTAISDRSRIRYVTHDTRHTTHDTKIQHRDVFILKYETMTMTNDDKL